MFLSIVDRSFTATETTIEQKLASFSSYDEKISNLIKTIDKAPLSRAWAILSANVTVIKTGSQGNMTTDADALRSCLSTVIARVQELQNKALEKMALPIEIKEIDYEFFLRKWVLSTIREAYAKKSLSAYIDRPNTCEAFSELASHILKGDYGSEIREWLVGDCFEQSQMLLLLLVDRLGNRQDLRCLEVFESISEQEMILLVSITGALKETIVPFLTSNSEIKLPEHTFIMGLLARCRIKNEGEFGNVIEYYRALYSPTIGQLLHLALAARSAYIDRPNTCEALSELVSHILKGNYGSEIRKRLVGDCFEQSQMLLLLLVDRLGNRQDLRCLEVFESISEQEMTFLVSVTDVLRKTTIPFLTSNSGIKLPEHTFIMGLLARCRIKNEGEFGNIIEYYRALYNPTIGQLLHLALASSNPHLAEVRKDTVLSKQKLALFVKALEIVAISDPEQTKQLLVKFLGTSNDTGFAERRAISAELLAIMGNLRPRLALDFAHRIFTQDEKELAAVAAGILAHAAMRDTKEALKLAESLRLKVSALTEASRALAKRHPRQALQLAAPLKECATEELGRLYLLICRYHSIDARLKLVLHAPWTSVFFLEAVDRADIVLLGDDQIERLLKHIDKTLDQPITIKVRLVLANRLEANRPHLAWTIASLTKKTCEAETRMDIMCRALTSIAKIDVRKAVVLCKGVKWYEKRLDDILRLALLEHMKNRSIEDAVAMLPEIPPGYHTMLLASAVIRAHTGDLDANLRALGSQHDTYHPGELAYQSGTQLGKDALKILLTHFDPSTHDSIRVYFLQGAYAADVKMTAEEVCSILDGIHHPTSLEDALRFLHHPTSLEDALRFLYKHKNFCPATEAEIHKHIAYMAYIGRCRAPSQDELSFLLVQKISASFPDLAKEITSAINNPYYREEALRTLKSESIN